MNEAWILAISLAAATIRVGAPLVLAALAGLYAERSGVVDIGLEGKMLAAAFAAAAAAAVTGSPWPGLAAGVLAATALAALHGFACVTLNGNQTISGLAVNALAAGLSPVLAAAWFHEGGRSPLLEPAQRFLPIELPFAASAGKLPVIGQLYAGVISGHNLIVYLAAFAVAATGWVIYRTRFGLRLRAVGENPHAIDTAGVSVAWLRYRALLIGGLLSGLAGTSLSIAHGAQFIQDMTAGKGFLALAALIFGKWRPWPTLAACLLFAFTDALQARLQGVPLPLVGVVPVQFIQALPYALTVLLLAGFVGRAVAPAAIGLPFVKTR